MFRTHRSMLISDPAHSYENAIWSCVEHCIELPWFYISVRRKPDNQPVVMQIMDPQVFVELLNQDTKDLYVDSVQLVSPPKINGTNTWMMEELVSFSHLYHPNLGGSELYEVASGKYYSMIDPDHLRNESKIKRTIIYTAAASSQNQSSPT